MELFHISILEVLIEIIIFVLLTFLLGAIINKIREKDIELLDLKQYFPDEEIHSLKQIFYLIMIGLFFVNILYSLVYAEGDLIYFALFDIIVSIYLAVMLDKSSLKNKLLLLLLIPYGALTYLLFGNSLVGLLDFIHIPVFIYFIKVYFDKFREYTSSNGLGITILLLFIIVFISFLLTQIVENVNPLDSMVMVSNAFTSNGYAILGSTIAGKLNAIFLVWGGYLLSGVGTATLTATILINHYNKRLEGIEDKLDELLKKDNED